MTVLWRMCLAVLARGVAPGRVVRADASRGAFLEEASRSLQELNVHREEHLDPRKRLKKAQNVTHQRGAQTSSTSIAYTDRTNRLFLSLMQTEAGGGNVIIQQKIWEYGGTNFITNGEDWAFFCVCDYDVNKCEQDHSRTCFKSGAAKNRESTMVDRGQGCYKVLTKDTWESVTGPTLGTLACTDLKCNGYSSEEACKSNGEARSCCEWLTKKMIDSADNVVASAAGR